jgi:hypothetical protein
MQCCRFVYCDVWLQGIVGGLGREPSKKLFSCWSLHLNTVLALLTLYVCFYVHVQGIVSGLGRELSTGLSAIKGVIQTDAAINPGAHICSAAHVLQQKASI